MSDFENIMDFAMNIDKLNLANLVGEVMDGQDHKVPDFFSKSVQKDKN